MMDPMRIIKEKELKRISATEIDYNGTRYHYIMNSDKKDMALTKASADDTGINMIFNETAWDLNVNLLSDHVAVYVSDKDYATNTCVSRMIKSSIRIMGKYKRKLLDEGLIDKDTPLYEIHPGYGGFPPIEDNIGA